jgi:hypothetical protein
VYGGYLWCCGKKARCGAQAEGKMDGFKALKRWLEMRIKYAGFVEN